MSFQEMIRDLRNRRGLTLRKFCLANGLDPSNWSKLERGILPPPKRGSVLQRWAIALGLERNTRAWQEFMDAAELARGQVPADLLKKPDLHRRILAFIHAIRQADEDAETRPKPSPTARKRKAEAEEGYAPARSAPIDDFID